MNRLIKKYVYYLKSSLVQSIYEVSFKSFLIYGSVPCLKFPKYNKPGIISLG